MSWRQNIKRNKEKSKTKKVVLVNGQLQIMRNPLWKRKHMKRDGFGCLPV